MNLEAVEMIFHHKPHHTTAEIMSWESTIHSDWVTYWQENEMRHHRGENPAPHPTLKVRWVKMSRVALQVQRLENQCHILCLDRENPDLISTKPGLVHHIREAGYNLALDIMIWLWFTGVFLLRTPAFFYPSGWQDMATFLVPTTPWALSKIMD